MGCPGRLLGRCLHGKKLIRGLGQGVNTQKGPSPGTTEHTGGQTVGPHSPSSNGGHVRE